MTTDLNTLLTALYVKIDDHLGKPTRPGRPPRLTDAELLTFAVAQVLLGVRSETRWLRFVPATSLEPSGTCPNNPATTSARAPRSRCSNASSAGWPPTPTCGSDPVWIVDSTPVKCARSRPTVQRSDLAGWAGYGYCASHSRFFRGLRLHLICTPAGLPVTWALANPSRMNVRALMAVLDHDPVLLTERMGLVIVADKGYVSAELDAYLAQRGVRLLRPSYRNRTPHPAQHLLKPIRQ